MGHNIPCPPQKSKIAQLNMSILCLSVNCLTIVRHYRHSWHVATHHWHSYRQPLKYQLTTQINNQCQSLFTFYWQFLSLTRYDMSGIAKCCCQ
jgi:hypothetical protein